MQLFIQSLTGATVTLNGCSCVNDVRHMVHVRLKVHPDVQILSVNGKPLRGDGNLPLRDVGIKHMSSIQLSIRLSGGRGPLAGHDVSSDDFYNVLGVGRQSSDSDIAKAYRTLALRYHPDRNDSPTAEEHFKRISAAYDTLKDKTKRANYDQFGKDVPTQAQRPTNHSFGYPSPTFNQTSHERFSYADASEVFRQFFGNSDPRMAFETTRYDGVRLSHMEHMMGHQMFSGRWTSGVSHPTTRDDNGRMVRVSGLVHNTMHNGMVGQVVRNESDTRRVIVRMTSAGDIFLALKSKNISPLAVSVLCGLRKRTELNGKTAYISERTLDGRYIVFIPPMATQISVKLSRMRLATNTPVSLHNLSNAKYNGTSGRIVDAAADGSQYTVETTKKKLLTVKVKYVIVTIT
jgi:hypothetical protein